MIKVFKMINGEELIAKVTGQTEKEYSVESPSAIMLQQQGESIGVGLAPYMPYASDIALQVNAVAAVGTPDVNLENEYNRLFGSGLTIASASTLAGLK